MKISLIYNPAAGDGFSLERLRRDIEAAGHVLVQQVEKGSESKRGINDQAEIVAIAGGDGTVREVVQALQPDGAPFAILPFGTANNIARSLGYEGSPDELVRRWESGRLIPFDLGLARGNWGERRFLEGVGIRLIPEFIRTAKQRLKDAGERGSDTELDVARRVFRETLALLKPQRCSLTADGDRMDGDFLLVEILNIQSVGPQLSILPGASPSDGFLDLVTAGEEGRDELFELLAPASDNGAAPALPTRRVRCVEILDWGAMHIDDELEDSATGAVSIAVEPGKVEFLV